MSERRGLEVWARFALVVVVLAVVELAVLGSRPGGRLPIVLYVVAIPLTGVVAGATLLFGILCAVRRRPALQRGRMPVLLALALVVWLCTFPLAYPSSREGHPSSVEFALPVRGDWTVEWGGDRREDNVLVLNPSRRFGLALVPRSSPDASGGPPRDLTVVAPAPGTVAVVDRVGDRGRLVLTVAADEHLVLEGLDPDGVRVAVGAEVARGAALGALPAGPGEALVVSLQDRPEPGRGEGVPFRLSGVLVDGRPAAPLAPVRGQRLRAATD